jgi:hypothetical protein
MSNMGIHRAMAGLISYDDLVTGNDGNVTPTFGVVLSFFEKAKNLGFDWVCSQLHRWRNFELRFRRSRW